MKTLLISGVSRAALGIYHNLLSPLIVMLFGPACRFEPSCSNYADEAIAHYGIARGGWQAFKRLMRCRPGGGWGYDPVVARHPLPVRGPLADGSPTSRESCREALVMAERGARRGE